MRRVVQIYLVTALALCSILLSALNVAWLDWEDLVPGHPDGLSDLTSPGKAVELVIFGGSWSDSAVFGHHALESTRLAPNSTSSKGWAEHLCDSLDCLYRNYGSIHTGNLSSNSCSGGLVETGLFTKVNFEDTQNIETPEDLKAQIKRWSSHNDRTQAILGDGGSSRRANKTIFVLDFGLWDIWKLALRERDDGEYIVKTSIDIIFSALDYLDSMRGNVTIGNVTEPVPVVRAILPYVIDMTFLPGYSKDVEVEKRTVDLVKIWNSNLSERAHGWGKGDILLYDTNDFMIQHIKARQMISVNSNHATRDTAKPPAFSDVSSSCLRSLGNTTVNSDSENGVVCAAPDDFLFWDELHFGPKAHQLIAQEMLRDISLEGGWT